ncbi:MAG: hypothetical protein LBR91_00375 [Puniceicoccales bacterium]|nr:hypothetical protein [Puniceicoccales bacterium]
MALNFGDFIEISTSSSVGDEIFFDGISADWKNNSIQTAIDLFRSKTLIGKYFRIFVKKNIPIGSGFGGGSSNGAVVLREVNRICGGIFSATELEVLSGEIGADCPFFIRGLPSIVGGIGDVCWPIDKKMTSALENYDLIIFKPPFSVNTSEAYAALRENFRRLYVTKEEAENKFFELREAAISKKGTLPLFNTFAEIFFADHENLANLCHDLRNIGASTMLTGSGSGFFCLTKGSSDVVEKKIRRTLGEDVFLKKTSFILR